MKESWRNKWSSSDSVNKQMIDWVSSSLEINPEYKLAIKGDEATNYRKKKKSIRGT